MRSIDYQLVHQKKYANELKDTDPAKIRAFYKNYFFKWRPEFEYLPKIRARVTQSGEYPRWAKSSAQTYKTILEQPVVGEFSKIRVSTLLVVGQNDHTVVGKNYMRPEVARNFGHFPALAVSAMRQFGKAIVIILPNTGHIPHLESPKPFQNTLIRFLLVAS